MDAEFMEKMKAVGKPKKRFWQRGESDELELEMEILDREDGEYAILKGPMGEIEHRLKTLEELYAPESERPKRTLGDEEEYMDLLMTIERSIGGYYQTHPSLTDRDVIFVLEKLGQKPERPTENELAADIQLAFRLHLSMNVYTRHEVRWGLRKILGSVRRHHKLGGPKGYLDFIADYV